MVVKASVSNLFAGTQIHPHMVGWDRPQINTTEVVRLLGGSWLAFEGAYHLAGCLQSSGLEAGLVAYRLGLRRALRG
jgi:hypothetical protein